jgi:hypothetical protein
MTMGLLVGAVNELLGSFYTNFSDPDDEEREESDNEFIGRIASMERETESRRDNRKMGKKGG